MKSLIFFDINGTIIERDHRTDLPFSLALDHLLNKENTMFQVNTSARSDQDVFIEVLGKYDLTFTEDLWQSFLVLYTEQLEKYKNTDIWRANVDVVEFIKSIAKSHHLSLITGELSIGAAYKLKKIGLWQYFDTGGFGEDGLKRFDIADKAYEKAQKKFGKTYDNIFVIGDTILDIKTARHLGAQIISIATGSNTYDELAVHQPDHLIQTYKEITHLF